MMSVDAGEAMSNESSSHNATAAAANGDVSDDVNVFRPRLCELRQWTDFDGYGFDVHVNDDDQVKYIGKIDPGSPADAAGK